jgi:hypothetical protein
MIRFNKFLILEIIFHLIDLYDNKSHEKKLYEVISFKKNTSQAHVTKIAKIDN